MTENKSAPPGPVVPGRFYDDVGAAIEWICSAFGFIEIYRYGPPERPQGAFLSTGNDGSVDCKSLASGNHRAGTTTRSYARYDPVSPSVAASMCGWITWTRTTAGDGVRREGSQPADHVPVRGAPVHSR